MNAPIEELATLYVLDQLDAPDRAAFEARLVREPALATLVRELEAGLSHGVRSLPPQQPPADLLGKIEAKIGADANRWSPGSARAETVRSAGSTWIPFAKWGIAAVIAVSLGILAVQSLRQPPAQPVIVVVGLDANRNTFTELPLQGSAKDPDSRFIQLASLAQRFVEQPSEVPAAAKPAGGDNRGYALFDPASQQGFIAIEQLSAIAANQRYHLWVVDPANGQIRDAGVLPSSTSRGLYSFALNDTSNAKSGHPHFFVTIEDDNAPAQPRGKVVLGSKSF